MVDMNSFDNYAMKSPRSQHDSNPTDDAIYINKAIGKMIEQEWIMLRSKEIIIHLEEFLLVELVLPRVIQFG